MVAYGAFPVAACLHDAVGPLVIFVPERDPLEMAWDLARELHHIKKGWGGEHELCHCEAWASLILAPDPQMCPITLLARYPAPGTRPARVVELAHHIVRTRLLREEIA